MKQEFLKKYWIFLVFLFGALYELFRNFNIESFLSFLLLGCFIVYLYFSSNSAIAKRIIGIIFIGYSCFAIVSPTLQGEKFSPFLIIQHSLTFFIGLLLAIDKLDKIYASIKNKSVFRILFILFLAFYFNFSLFHLINGDILDKTIVIFANIFAVVLLYFELIPEKND